VRVLRPPTDVLGSGGSGGSGGSLPRGAGHGPAAVSSVDVLDFEDTPGGSTGSAGCPAAARVVVGDGLGRVRVWTLRLPRDCRRRGSGGSGGRSGGSSCGSAEEEAGDDEEDRAAEEAWWREDACGAAEVPWDVARFFPCGVRAVAPLAAREGPRAPQRLPQPPHSAANAAAESFWANPAAAAAAAEDSEDAGAGPGGARLPSLLVALSAPFQSAAFGVAALQGAPLLSPLVRATLSAGWSPADATPNVTLANAVRRAADTARAEAHEGKARSRATTDPPRACASAAAPAGAEWSPLGFWLSKPPPWLKGAQPPAPEVEAAAHAGLAAAAVAATAAAAAAAAAATAAEIRGRHSSSSRLGHAGKAGVAYHPTAWLGLHHGGVASVCGEATVSHGLRLRETYCPPPRVNPRNSPQPRSGRRDAGGRQRSGGSGPVWVRPARLVTGGGDWAVHVWELADPRVVVEPNPAGELP
jgi:hypothetical protein